VSAAKKLNLAYETGSSGVAIAKPAMISPFWDMICTGGLSLFLFALMSVTLARVAPDNAIGLWVFNLSFAVNFPHFLASYQILYGDFRHRITQSYRFFFAAVIVPIVLCVGMAEAFAASNPTTLGYFVVAMYFFVGWHYVKQTFGVIVVSNAYRKIFYNKEERFWLLANMYSVWAVSFFNSNATSITYNQMGIPYPSLNFSYYPVYVSYGVLGASIIGTIYMHIRKYIREGSIPPASAFTAYFTIYLFLLPLTTHPMYMHTAPFFHSLQYLLFVFAFRANKVESEVAKLPAIEGRKRRILGIGGFFAGSILLGALSFAIIPGLFDATPWLNRALFGPTPFVFFATIFINIHHYFIDNVIWKGNNPEIREHLFKAS